MCTGDTYIDDNARHIAFAAMVARGEECAEARQTKKKKSTPKVQFCSFAAEHERREREKHLAEKICPGVDSLGKLTPFAVCFFQAACKSTSVVLYV